MYRQIGFTINNELFRWCSDFKTAKKKRKQRRRKKPQFMSKLLITIDGSCQRGWSSFSRRVNRWPWESDHILKQWIIYIQNRITSAKTAAGLDIWWRKNNGRKYSFHQVPSLKLQWKKTWGPGGQVPLHTSQSGWKAPDDPFSKSLKVEKLCIFYVS